MLLPVVAISVVGWFADVSAGLEMVATVFATVAIVPALGGITYKGVLFSITAQPGWRDARWLGAYGCSSGPALGSAVLLLIAVLADSTGAVKSLQTTTLALIAISTVTLGLLRRDFHPELRLRRTPERRRLLYIGVVLSGLIVPVTLLLLGTSAASCALAAASVLAADFTVRFVFVSIPHSDPRLT
jgi:hypothetical protein